MKKTRKNNPVLFLCIVGIIFFSLMSVVFGDVAIGTEKNKNVAENGLIVTATFTELDKTFLGINTQYVLRYYYKDDNGVEYTGTTTYMYELKEEAEKHIGEKVQIKIDGKGHSMFADYSPPSPVLFWILCVLCVLAVGILLVISIFNVKKRRKLKKEYKEKHEI